MKNLKKWWKSLDEYNHEKAKLTILINFVNFEGHELNVMERITLLNTIKNEVELMLIKDLLKAENEVESCKKYFSGLTSKKIDINDPIFNEPILNINYGN